MIEFKYYTLGTKPYCVLSIYDSFNKTFILPDCKYLVLSKQTLMIEVDILEDYFLEEKSELLLLDYSIKEPCDFKYFSKEKFNISFTHKEVSHSLKSYVPFWGKALSNICWVGFLS